MTVELWSFVGVDSLKTWSQLKHDTFIPKIGRVEQSSDSVRICQRLSCEYPDYNYFKPFSEYSPFSLDQRLPFAGFPVSEDINNKLYLVKGDICLLDVSVISCFTNETLDLNEGLSKRLLNVGGTLLRDAISREDRCRSGEARLVRGFCRGGTMASPGPKPFEPNSLYLGSRYICYTIGPRFNVKYQIAAHNTLHSCYRESLKLLVESKLSSIAFPAAFCERFPPDEFMHTCLRSIRRWMERLKSIENVILVCEDDESFRRLLALAPLYFPRSSEEALWALSRLPRNIGNEFGEFDVEERKIRIESFMYDKDCDSDTGTMVPKGKSIDPEVTRDRLPVLTSRTDSGAELITELDLSFSQSKSGLLTNSERRIQASTTVDDRPISIADAAYRLLNTNCQKDISSGEVPDVEGRYQRLLRSANQPDVMKILIKISEYRFIYKGGYDRANRNLIVFCGALFPAAVFEWQHLLIYIVKVMDQFVHDRYAVLYINAEVTLSANHPGILLLKELWELYSGECQNTLDAFYVLYPSLLFRAAFGCCFPFISERVWNGTKYLYDLQSLEKYCDLSSIQLPRYVKEYAERQNGTSWSKNFKFI